MKGRQRLMDEDVTEIIAHPICTDIFHWLCCHEADT
jgi:hypothetical protein